MARSRALTARNIYIDGQAGQDAPAAAWPSGSRKDPVQGSRFKDRF